MIDLIENYICKQERINPDTLKSKSRQGNLPVIRQTIMTLAMECGVSSSIVSMRYGLDHATALHAKKHIKELCFGDKVFRKKIEDYNEGVRAIRFTRKEVISLEDELKELEMNVTSMEFRICNIRQRLNELKSKV